jgi:hypothetical protein
MAVTYYVALPFIRTEDGAPTLVGPPIELDDYWRAMDELLPAVSASVAAHHDRIEQMFLKTKAERFVPVP